MYSNALGQLTRVNSRHSARRNLRRKEPFSVEVGSHRKLKKGSWKTFDTPAFSLKEKEIFQQM